MSAVLDTHAAIWYVFARKRLSEDALRLIRKTVDSGKPVYISAISLIETIYLIERGRIPGEAIQRLEAALKAVNSGLVVAAVDEDVAERVHVVPTRSSSRYAGPDYCRHRALPGFASCHS